MKAEELARLAEKVKCRVLGHEDASNNAHRAVLAHLILGFNHPGATVLCEPGLARKLTRPPDCVLVDPVAGVHVVEVKGISLKQVEGIEPGGLLKIRYGDHPSVPKSPVIQARNAMFDIRDATARAHGSPDLTLPFRYWAALPFISREAWLARWGADAFAPAELLFVEDLRVLADTIREDGQRLLSNQGLGQWPTAQLNAVWRAFGDSAVLYDPPEERAARVVPMDTLADRFDEAAESYKVLSDDQQHLSAQDWSGGPRLVRGVAGSGKTIVLANNLARCLARSLNEEGFLFEEMNQKPRLLVVCYNRTLVPLIRQKIDLAFRQRTGRSLSSDALEVCYYNGLLYQLSLKGLWRYTKIGEMNDENRAGQYLADLEHARSRQPGLLGQHAYDAIYVDEGQDFLLDDLRVLKGLCRVDDGEPELFIFYDDAQNLLGRQRPNWKELGLKMIGNRSHVMTQCFRNTRPIVEASFNVLYGRHADPGAKVPAKTFGDIATLEQKGLIRDALGRYEVQFAPRDGIIPPRLTLAPHIRGEHLELTTRLRWLIEEQKVRPEDIFVLAYTWHRVGQVAEAIRKAAIPSITEVHVAKEAQDQYLRQRGRLSLSTVASAKGYDAYCVLIASADDFPTDVSGRASFYVGCTRAIEYLEVFAQRRNGLVLEWERAIAHAEQLCPST